MSVEVGQIWASTDKEDVAAGKRQHREVTAVQKFSACWIVFLKTKGSPQTGSWGTKVRNLARGIPRHRLVSPARPLGDQGERS